MFSTTWKFVFITCTICSSPAIKSNLNVNNFVPMKKITSESFRVKIRETVNVIIFEWPHWPVRKNIAVYQVVVSHVNTSAQEIGNQA